MQVQLLDITERKRAEEMLRQSETQYRTLVEKMNEGVLQVNNDSVFQFANERFCQMVGYSQDELLGKVAPDLMLQGKDLDAHRERFGRRMEGISEQYEAKFKKKLGELIWVRISAAPVIDADGTIVGAVSICTDITERKRAEEELRNHRDHLEEMVANRTIELVSTNDQLQRQVVLRERAQEALLQQTRDLTVLAEGNRLARDLHDSISQSLYSLTLFAEVGRDLAGSGDEEALSESLGRLGETAQQALKEMRLLVFELRPPVIEQEGLTGALQQRLDAVEGRAGVQASLLVDGIIQLPADLEDEIYRIAQEALTNVLKHASASSVTVRIAASNAHVDLEVEDNGTGFDPDTASSRRGMGLVSMRERTEELGGSLTILSALGEGTKVKASVPTQ